MDKVFQIFGSESSLDMDCMIFVDEIPSTQESHDLCYQWDEDIAKMTGTDKEVNSNLAVLENGIITETFKGTFEECNNSTYLTYSLHKQYHPNQIKGVIPRDVELKVLRTCRVILSFWSRSSHRPTIKSALRGDVYEKIKTIKSIDSTTINSLGKNVYWEDYLKIMAFQLGQTIGLLDGMELYTKEDIALNFPELEDYLMRKKPNSLQPIEDLKIELMDRLSDFKFINIKEIL